MVRVKQLNISVTAVQQKKYYYTQQGSRHNKNECITPPRKVAATIYLPRPQGRKAPAQSAESHPVQSRPAQPQLRSRLFSQEPYTPSFPRNWRWNAGTVHTAQGKNSLGSSRPTLKTTIYNGHPVNRTLTEIGAEDNADTLLQITDRMVVQKK